MKLIMIVAGDEYVEEITSILVEEGYYATNIGSSGDFLQYGNTILMLGVDDDIVDDVLGLLKGDKSSTHHQFYEGVSVYVLRIDNYLKMHIKK